MFGLNFGQTDQVKQDEYRTRDGRGYFLFNFVPNAVGRINVEIVRIENTDGVQTPISQYRQECLTAQSFREAQRIARDWAEEVWAQRRIGEDIPHGTYR